MASYLASASPKWLRVLLYMHNSPQYVIAYYALSPASTVVELTNSMNVTGELGYYVQDSKAGMAFVGQERYNQVAPPLRDNSYGWSKTICLAIRLEVVSTKVPG